MGWRCRKSLVILDILFSRFLTIEPCISGPWCVLPFSLLFGLLIENKQAIAVYTFCVLVLRWSAPKIISKVVVLTIWIFIALIIAIPYHINKPFYGNAGYCKSQDFDPHFYCVDAPLKGVR